MKIIASDFDDTFYMEDDMEQTKKNILYVRKFIAEGNIFCIITGRNYSSLKELLNQYKIPYSYLICEDGAKMFNNMDYSFDTTLLDKEQIEKVVPILDNNHCVYHLDDGYNETFNYSDCVKIVVDCKDEEEQQTIIDIVNKNCDVHIYASRNHVNIIHKSINKEKALRKLFEIEKLNINDLYVIGDNGNDYEMLKAFPGGLMKKHHPILEQLPKKEYDGFSDFVEELMKK